MSYTVTASATRHSISARPVNNPLDATAAVSPQKLARLDLGLLRSLNQLGTSRERICAVLSLSAEEYDYISALA